MSDEELNIFCRNIGGFVQMEGFLSMSIDKNAAFEFAARLSKEKKMPQKKKLVRTFIEVEVKQ